MDLQLLVLYKSVTMWGLNLILLSISLKLYPSEAARIKEGQGWVKKTIPRHKILAATETDTGQVCIAGGDLGKCWVLQALVKYSLSCSEAVP